MRVIIVGRHTPADTGENFEIVGQLDIMLPGTTEMSFYTLRNLVEAAMLKEAEAIVFQGLPGQMAVAIAKFARPQWVRIGVIVSVPGERPAATTRMFHFDSNTALIEAGFIVRLLNPNAQLEEDDWEMTMRITVDPPMKFEYSHIEWF